MCNVSKILQNTFKRCVAVAGGCVYFFNLLKTSTVNDHYLARSLNLLKSEAS